jgi:hypothetical protein
MAAPPVARLERLREDGRRCSAENAVKQAFAKLAAEQALN